jgi:bacterioferritin-associated ferredoxin
MYVCICQGITEKQVEEAVNARKGQTPKDVLRALGVGSDCGTCVEDAVKKLIDKTNRTPFEAKDSSKKS